MNEAKAQSRAQAYRTSLVRVLGSVLAGGSTAKARSDMQSMVVATLYSDLPDAYLHGQLDAQEQIEALAILVDRLRQPMRVELQP